MVWFHVRQTYSLSSSLANVLLYLKDTHLGHTKVGTRTPGKSGCQMVLVCPVVRVWNDVQTKNVFSLDSI